MIRPYPRYRELFEQRGLHVDSAARAPRRFSARDFVDLVCWNNLVWFHPIAFEKHEDLAELRRKGSHYSEEEKNWLLDKQLEILAEVIPLHRKLAERGQLELTTTPFYHPILPLLVDKKLARAAMPSVQLPRRLERPVAGPGRPLFDPLADQLDLSLRELLARLGRRHAPLRIGFRDAQKGFALVRLTGGEGGGAFLGVQAQLGLALLLVGPVTLEASVGEDGPDVAGEIDAVRRPRRGRSGTSNR